MTNDWDDEYDEYDEEWSDDDDEETLVVTCPNCDANVYEDAEQCPICGEYIVHSSNVWSDKPAWWIMLGVAGIIATIILLSGLML